MSSRGKPKQRIMGYVILERENRASLIRDQKDMREMDGLQGPKIGTLMRLNKLEEGKNKVRAQLGRGQIVEGHLGCGKTWFIQGKLGSHWRVLSSGKRMEVCKEKKQGNKLGGFGNNPVETRW